MPDLAASADAVAAALAGVPVELRPRGLTRGAIDRAAARRRFSAPDQLTAAPPGARRVAEALEDGRVDRALGALLPGCALNLAALRAAAGPGALAALTRLAAGAADGPADPSLHGLPTHLVARCTALASSAEAAAVAAPVARALGLLEGEGDLDLGRIAAPPPRRQARGAPEDGGRSRAGRSGPSERQASRARQDGLGRGAQHGAGGQAGGAGHGAGVGTLAGGEAPADLSPQDDTRQPTDGGEVAASDEAGDDGGEDDSDEREEAHATDGGWAPAGDVERDPWDEDAQALERAWRRRRGHAAAWLDDAPLAYRSDPSGDRVRVLPVTPHPRANTLWTAAAPLGQALAARARLALPEAGPAWRRDLERGRLDERHLARVALSDERVFCRRLPRRRVDAALTVLLDSSGSLSTPQHRRVLVAGLALALAAEALDVDTEILGFTTQRAAGSRPGFDRAVPLLHLVLKPFERQARSCRYAFGHATSIERQNNVDGEAVAWAARRLTSRGRRSRLLVVVSDGRPNTGERGDSPPDRGDPRLEAHLRQVVARLERAGTRVLGLGLDAPRVADLYPRARVLGPEDDPTLALGEALRQLMRDA